MEEKTKHEVEPLLTVGQLADILQVNTSWVYRAVRLKRIPVTKCGKYVRFQLSRVLAALEV